MKTFLKVRQILAPSERRDAFLLLVFMMVGMWLETLSIGLVVPVTSLMMQDDLVEKYELANRVLEFFSYPDQSDIIVGAMICLATIYFSKNLFLAFLVWRQSKFAYGVQGQVSQRLFSIYLAQPYTFHLQRNSAQLIRNVTTETNMLTQSINACLLITTEALVVIGITLLLLIIEPVGAVVVALILAMAGYAFLQLTKKRILGWGQARQFHEGMRIQHIQQGLGGIKDVLVLGRADNFLREYQWHNRQSAKVASYQYVMQQLPRLWLEFLAITGLAMLVVLMVKQGGDLQRILPTLGVFAAAVFRLIPSANRILGSIQAVRYGMPVVNTLYEALGLKDDMRRDKAFKPLRLLNEIVLKDLCFSYSTTSVNALQDINLRIGKGESIGFIGESGSGKSTLVDVIMGLLMPQTGTVFVDGKDVANNISGWQSQIGYVPQSIYLTDDTLRRNIAFGFSDDAIDNEAVIKAAVAAQLEDFIAGLPKGLDTVVGERGVRISGGQRQRIGIARALYHDPEVLILDEATSALDTTTEREVMRAIEALHGSKTIIIVAHRLSTIEYCDRIYRFEHGRKVEEGLPADIVYKNDDKQITS